MGNRTSRSDFNETWIMEMPNGINTPGVYEALVYNIKERIEYGAKIIQLPNNLNKIKGNTMVFYWYGDNDHIILATELRVAPEGLIVSLTGKDPKYKGGPPFASQLYDEIIKDTHKALRLLSDTKLSDEGYAIWKKLFNLGHNIMIYDQSNPGQSYKICKSIEDMDQYFAHHNKDYEKYQYILAEHEEMGDILSIFGLRRARELCGLSTED